jgi:hypothetical protein
MNISIRQCKEVLTPKGDLRLLVKSIKVFSLMAGANFCYRRWSPQKRPYRVTSKPAYGPRPGLSLLYRVGDHRGKRFF